MKKSPDSKISCDEKYENELNSIDEILIKYWFDTFEFWELYNKDKEVAIKKLGFISNPVLNTLTNYFDEKKAITDSTWWKLKKNISWKETNDELSDKAISIILHELHNLFDSKLVFDTQREMNEISYKFMLSIEDKIGEIDPSIFNANATMTSLKEFFMNHWYYLDLIWNKITINNSSKHAVFISLHPIINVDYTTFNNYLPENIPSPINKFPHVKVTTLWKNLMPNFEKKLKEELNVDFISKKWVSDNGEIFLYDESLIWDSKISRKQEKKLTLANEMGHVIFHYLFEGIQIEKYNNLTFEYTNGKSYTFQNLNEAVSDITELNQWKDNIRMFMYTLNENLSRQGIMDRYTFSSDIITYNFKLVLKELWISGMHIPAEKFKEFRTRLLEKVNNDVFWLVKSFIAIISKKEKKSKK